MRCPDCNKFVSYDESAEPEVNDLQISEGNVTGQVRVLLTCAECGTELKEANFDIDVSVELPEHHTCHVAAIEGCAPHVAGTPCAVCKWDGVPVVRYKQELERFDENAPSDHGEPKYIGRVGFHYYRPAEREEFERAFAHVERLNAGIPQERKFVPAREEQDSFEAEVDSVELTTRSSCGVNKKTGKPNKFNPRYATTYYGYTLSGEVRCDCGEIKVEFESSDDTEASSMDELV